MSVIYVLLNDTNKSSVFRGAFILGDDMRYSWKRHLLHLFFPTRCPICGCIIGAMDRFCTDCADKLNVYDDCLSIEGAESFTAAFRYDDTSKPAIFLLKRGVDGNAAYSLGGALADRIKADGIAERIDVIVPAPMHRKDVKRRGFNQAALIAREVGRELGIPVDEKAVSKTRLTQAQKQLDRLSRTRNLRNAFSADPSALKNKRVLLIDDICTTGSTLREITSVIMKNGAASVRCACCCKTYRNDSKGTSERVSQDAQPKT